MRYANVLSGLTLVALSVSNAYAGPVEVVSGDLIVNLGDASANNKSRTLVLGPGDRRDQVSYVFIDEDGTEILDTVSGYRGDVSIQSNIGRDTIEILGLGAGNLTINTGRGNDTVYLNLVEATETLDIRTGGGRDNVMFINQVVEGNTSIRTQGGQDDVSITNSFFEGAVAVRTGGAADKLSVAFSGFAGSAPLFNGQGHGNDTYTDDGNNGFWTGDPRIRNFENVDEPVIEEPVPEPTPLAIGDIGPGGGIVFQVNGDGTGLEVFADVVANAAYGCHGTVVVDLIQQSEERLSRTGAENSADLAATNCSPAAEAVFAFSTDNGQTDDWYLPSAAEVRTILTALSPAQFAREEGGAFVTSSEDTDENSYFLLVTNLEIAPGDKRNPADVLAIRSF
jgi:hypothetical protein